MKPAVTFASFVETLDQLDRTSSSSAMFECLARLFRSLPPADARPAAYLLQGQLAPDYAGVDFGIAEKFVLRAIAAIASKSLSRVEDDFRRRGDLGDLAARYTGSRPTAGLRLREVFSELRKVAEAQGPDSQKVKRRLLVALLRNCSANEARYVIRIVLGKLRLGVAEMTLLKGLAVAVTGSKATKDQFEHAFNVLSDFGEVVELALRSGVDRLQRVQPVVGKPVRMMLAQRIKDLREVREHAAGPVHVEFKYDGERVQAHLKQGGQVTLFSRRQTDITLQYPEVAAGLRAGFRGRSAIVEGELIAVDPRTGALRDFQTLMHRRRVHDVEQYRAKVPVRCFLFDMLHLDGKSLLERPLTERKLALRRSLRPSQAVAWADFIATDKVAEMRDFFDDVTHRGAEGVMVKDAHSHYEAGLRGWHWMKYKKEYCQQLADTFDLAVVGAIVGRGARAGQYGSLLVATFNPTTSRYESLTKVGAGFSDRQLSELPKLLRPYQIAARHSRVDTGMKADVWFRPALVMEVTGAQLTVSPTHAAAHATVKRGGLALRFPRFLHWRDDKSAQQATTSQEVYELYKRSTRPRRHAP